MYINEEFYTEWLPSLKRNLGISLDDTYKDEDLLTYLNIAHKNIWTNYLKKELISFKGEAIVPLDNQLAYDKRVKMATIHLATSYYSNPDGTIQTNNTVINNRHIAIILGDLVKYFRKV